MSNKELIKTIDENLSSDSDSDSGSSIDEPEPINEPINVEPEPSVKLVRTKSIKPRTKKIIEKDGYQIEVRSKKKGAPVKKKKKIVIYKEDFMSDEEETEIEIKHKNRTKGRPKTKQIVYVEAPKQQEPQIIVKEKKPTAKQLKKMENEINVNEMEEKIGRKIVRTKKGEADKRSTKLPSKAQIEARKRFGELQTKRAQERKQKKEEELSNSIKSNVKEAVKELTQQAPPPQAQAPAPPRKRTITREEYNYLKAQGKLNNSKVNFL